MHARSKTGAPISSTCKRACSQDLVGVSGKHIVNCRVQDIPLSGYDTGRKDILISSGSLRKCGL